jgi:hypothetical protein
MDYEACGTSPWAQSPRVKEPQDAHNVAVDEPDPDRRQCWSTEAMSVRLRRPDPVHHGKTSNAASIAEPTRERLVCGDCSAWTKCQ